MRQVICLAFYRYVFFCFFRKLKIYEPVNVAFLRSQPFKKAIGSFNNYVD